MLVEGIVDHIGNVMREACDGLRERGCTSNIRAEYDGDKRRITLQDQDDGRLLAEIFPDEKRVEYAEGI